MKVFTYSEARQNLSQLLSLAKTEEVEIRKRDGSVFSIKAKKEGVLEILCQFYNQHHHTMRRIDNEIKIQSGQSTG